MSRPVFSVIVPVRDGAELFGRCLAALAAASGPEVELLVVDDGSTDDSARRALDAGARLLSSAGRGPAAARNAGAGAASADWLLFLDADCAVHADTFQRAAAAVAEHPEADAFFGAYDDAPEDPGWISQYRNLLHCHTHRTARSEASTFWSGCGLVKRDAFFAVGGFDPARFPRLGMEDIDLGYRLRGAGHRIRLDPRIEVTHLKAWGLRSVVRGDLFERGIPWMELWLERRGVPADLNLAWRHRVTAASAVALTAAPFFLRFSPGGLPTGVVGAGIAAAAVGTLLLVNRAFFAFLAERRGFLFAASAVPLHFLYGLCCATSFLVGAIRHLRSRLRGRLLHSSRRPGSATAPEDAK